MNTTYQDGEGQTALHAAAYGGHLALVHIILQSGAALDKLDRSQNTPLSLALIQGHNETVKYLAIAGSCTSLKVGFHQISSFGIAPLTLFLFYLTGGRWDDCPSLGVQKWQPRSLPLYHDAGKCEKFH